MDYSELVKRLREHNGWALNETLDAAADAIEELQAAVEREKTYWYGIWQGGNRMSGIYIPGIRKPLYCLQCPCSGTDVDDGKEFWICEITHRVLTSTELCDNATNDCPLIPVPDHGRLIDADALCEGRVSNDNVVICAKCAPTIIPADKEGEE